MKAKCPCFAFERKSTRVNHKSRHRKKNYFCLLQVISIFLSPFLGQRWRYKVKKKRPPRKSSLSKRLSWQTVKQSADMGDMIKPTIFTYVLARQKFIRHCCLLLELQTLSNVYSNRQLEGRAEIKHYGLCAVFNTPIRLQHYHTIQSAIFRLQLLCLLLFCVARRE